jgi:cellulose synthase/poly-beta-1,6-N-acetylglucosamine synthase-like glycosyltransferase
VIIPAYLEEEVIAAKISDARQQGYPGPLQLTVVAEDPGTAEAAREAGAQVILSEERLGKAEAINRAAARAEHPVLVITDANARLEPGSLAALGRWFQDPSVGAVAGEKQESGGGRTLYWRFESWLKRQESRDGGTVALVGELAAIRRSLFRPIPADVAVDDLWIALDVIEQDGLIRYEPEAVAVEEPSPTLAAEWERRTRTTTGVIDVLVRRWRLLVPGTNAAVGKIWGHKLFRSVLGPIAHLGLLVQAIGRTRRSLLARLFVAAHLVGGAALLRERQGASLSAPERILGQFVFLQATAIGGLIRYARGDRPGIWPKEERPGSSGEVFDPPADGAQPPRQQA